MRAYCFGDDQLVIPAGAHLGDIESDRHSEVGRLAQSPFAGSLEKVHAASFVFGDKVSLFLKRAEGCRVHGNLFQHSNDAVIEDFVVALVSLPTET